MAACDRFRDHVDETITLFLAGDNLQAREGVNLDRRYCESLTVDMWYVFSPLLNGGSGADKEEILQ